MSFFAGRSRAQREHVFAALRALGPTTLEGLSASLSWSTRKTDKVLQAIVRSGTAGPLEYDPGTRNVSLGPRAPSGSPVPAAGAAPAAPTAPAAPALPKSWGTAARCPTCQVPLSSTGTGHGMYCPKCGRLPPVVASSRAGASPPPPTPPAPAPVTPLGAPITPISPGTADRRAQEMFAAWVTAQPIPCPKCQTPLRHRGVAAYGCPACGAQFAFERTGPRALVKTSTTASAPSGPKGPTL